jgi:hypothetical protein
MKVSKAAMHPAKDCVCLPIIGSRPCSGNCGFPAPMRMSGRHGTRPATVTAALFFLLRRIAGRRSLQAPQFSEEPYFFE